MKRLAFLLCITITLPLYAAEHEGQWSEERANEWYKNLPWLVGCNYNPATAINQLEMWQADTFDEESIDRELGWAEDLGFTSIRVYLHHMLWDQDAEGFLQRMERFLEISDNHGIGVMFVLLDSVWDPFPKLGKQREPKPFVHNSGWVQSPGKEIIQDPARHDEVKDYVQGVIRHFKDDKRVHAWDLINEPDNPNRSSYGEHEPENKAELSLMLLKKSFGWAREIAPSQPLTSGVWSGDWTDPDNLSPLNEYMLKTSDVISFHCYRSLDEMKKWATALERYNRPILCTEYMARPAGSTFEDILPYLKEKNIGAYNWGFVAGKTQTIFPWDSWQKKYTGEPPLWFHDIFRPDGTPYKQEEVELIKELTGKK